MMAVNTVEYLQGYQRALLEWRRLCEEAERLRALGTRVTSTFDGIPAGPADRSKVEAAVEGISDVLTKADAAKLNVSARRAEVEAAIAQLPDERHRKVMRLRYLSGYSWSRVADVCGYGERHVRRLHREALMQIAAAREKTCP